MKKNKFARFESEALWVRRKAFSMGLKGSES